MMPDFHQLRREGIGHLERTATAAWTDFNTHDPGITILEAFAYALTELGYRAGFDIGDIIASGDAGHQAFFSARTILTVNPTTPDDFRRLLVDLDGVRNAWVTCRDCGEPGGLYDVLLELEADPAFGDLNDRTILRRRTVPDAEGRRRPLVLEVRFPAWDLARRDQRRRLADPATPLTFTVDRLTRTTTGTAPVGDAELRRHWSEVFYVDVALDPDGTPVTIENAALRVFGDTTVRNATTVADLLGWLAEPGDNGFVAPYRGKLAATDRAVAAARSALEAHRNLDEDFCRLDLVEIDPIGVCADVEVAPSADIEAVQARIWYELERYLDPPVEFWSRDEMLAAGVPVEAMYNGPELAHGFLAEESLAASDLRTELRVSDILDRLVDLPGVVGVAGLRLVAYDTDGTPIPGATTGTSWRLPLRPGHRPRLHRRLSRFLFTSNGLPFVPRLDEAEDTLLQLRGRAARPQQPAADLDLPAPAGRPRDLGAYHPVQHSLPATYGIGPAGLPPTAGPLRRAQAKQLTGYLLVFEQLLRNAYAQLAHAADLFSLDPQTSRTSFAALLDTAGITDYARVVDALDATTLAGLVESPEEFLRRRHAFLDHLLARFGETFGEHDRQLADLQGAPSSSQHQVEDKIGYLAALPRLGHDRGKAFDRAHDPCHPDNASGLHQRVTRLLGLPARSFARRDTGALELVEAGRPVLAFVPGAEIRPALAAMVRTDRYRVVETEAGWQVEVLDTDDAPLGTVVEHFGTEEAARAFISRSATWAAHQRAIVVEHLLLRPKFPGDARYPACAEEDPYAFRLTYVLPGWTEPFSTTMDMRRFAERTIREQIPSHLLVKTCWVGNDGYLPDPCDPVIGALADVLEGPVGDREAACACAAEVLAAYGTAFAAWLAAHPLTASADVIGTRLAAAFAEVELSGVSCSGVVDAGVRAGLEEVALGHFTGIAQHGYQFERFEDAWCRWADAEAAIDWTAERLSETVVGMLRAGASGPVTDAALCGCATAILADVGDAFRTWLEAYVDAGSPPDPDTFEAPAVQPCDGVAVQPGTAEAIRALLRERYRGYTEVSHRLHVLVRALAALRSTYPRATLHDCDEGSDANPVRLGQTVLGTT